MGQAKQRGTYEERKAEAVARKTTQRNLITPEALAAELPKARRRMRSPLVAAMMMASIAGTQRR